MKSNMPFRNTQVRQIHPFTSIPDHLPFKHPSDTVVWIQKHLSSYIFCWQKCVLCCPWMPHVLFFNKQTF